MKRGQLRSELAAMNFSIAAFSRASRLSNATLYKVDDDPSQVSAQTLVRVEQTLARLRIELAKTPLLARAIGFA